MEFQGCTKLIFRILTKKYFVNRLLSIGKKNLYNLKDFKSSIIQTIKRTDS